MKKIKEIRPINYLTPNCAFHFHVIQFITFIYCIYRLASRNYSIYGTIPNELFNYSKPMPFGLWPFQPSYFGTYQFIWDIFPRIGVYGIELLQYAGICAGILGLIGILPRLCSVILFIILNHFAGFVQAVSAPVDGATVLLSSLLVLMISPNNNFYRIKKKINYTELSSNYQWPVYLLFLFIGFFYTTSGINKIIDIGFHWPFILHLENLAKLGVERAMFNSSYFVIPEISAMHFSELFSYIAGPITLLGEIGFLSILFLPRYRHFFVFTMCILHFVVFATAGITFIGSSFILLLCLDWNALVRKGTLYFDDNCIICNKIIKYTKPLFTEKKVKISQINNSISEHENLFVKSKIIKFIFVDDITNEVYYNVEALEQISIKAPLLWPIYILFKVPGMIYLFNFLFNKTAFKSSNHASNKAL